MSKESTQQANQRLNYRPNFHLSPPQGRLNDPNGIFLEGDTLHTYYQHDPGFPHAPKRTGWGHATTSLSSARPWTHHPDALYPDLPYDKDGCYSGGAALEEGEVWLFYTGNLKQEGRRIPSQNRVRALDPAGPEGGFYQRDPGNPLIPDAPEGYTGHFRDPHLSRIEGGWRMVLGVQTQQEAGTVVLYHSPDLERWDLEGEMRFDLSAARPGLSPDLLPGGYMWECPNLLTLKDKATGKDKNVLIFCPQGLERRDIDGQTHYASSDQCGYIVGHLEGTVFHVERGFSELDYGHEFYAPQAVEVGNGEALLLAWVGLPAQDEAPTLEQGWVHCLSLPRRVWLEGGRLRQLPWWEEVPEINTGAREGFGSTVVAESETAGAFALVDDAGNDVLLVESGGGVVRITRGQGTRCIACADPQLRLIADGSVAEIFAAGGDISAAVAVYGEDRCRWRGWERR
ncbi:glycoside hydrolase family 32 protein [Corynebacterium flavescens]|uniref:glycoside hydrolase family 32 protein n=1 Tax=Corynebacterium flavescens TaxID=28028 RepID=UPI000950F347|nr:glycoside hydrolase family 32 protein [Corynebacterium flavescens]MDN6099020.1 glycoside hydrolase family 32 protein [Corynebacterium flavescens]MDN6431278.1 glycoside hydrolase family 32 protein [Corynebacterium flavescens]MDN6474923.1 glycoside hydrolase family 32 protein [Corynebacterium flavescens]MDN6531156.1 glycoside hydrolase family 32 protein [Corynebacterium flavescens]MDN6600976.1 glycoside hydrolase family 32 protein [Corynebacterium flavescens]